MSVVGTGILYVISFYLSTIYLGGGLRTLPRKITLCGLLIGVGWARTLGIPAKSKGDAEQIKGDPTRALV
jgi:hypothetical protein